MKQLMVGLLVSACSLQAAADVGALSPSLSAQFHFGGPQQSQSFAAHLSFHVPRVGDVAHFGHAPQREPKLRYLSYSSSPASGSALHWMGAQIAAWSQPQAAEFVLQQNQQGAAKPSWFARNWWVVGLGVVAVGAAAASGGGGGSDDDESDGNSTNCGASGSPVGPGGITVDPNCPSG